jgi:hypothetical protein
MIPGGALAQPTLITLTGVAAPDAATLGAVPIGQGIEAGPAGLVFVRPVRLQLAFDVSRLPQGSVVSMRMAPHGTTAFSDLRSDVDPTSSTVSAEIAHFTTFVPSAEVNPLSITTPSTLPQATVDQPYAQSLIATGGTPPYRWTVSAGGSLPPGIELSTGGTLQGSASEAALDAFFITVTDAMSRSAQAAFSLTVTPLTNAVPVLTAITPSTVAAGSTGTTILVTGTAFVPTSRVQWDGAALATTFTSGSRLAAAVADAFVASAGNHAITVFTPAPGGGTSQPLTVSVFGTAGDAGPPSAGYDGGVLAPGLTTLAPGNAPMNVVVDGCYVYWTDQLTGGVMRVSKSGGDAVVFANRTLLPGVGPPAGQVTSNGLVIDANNLYWTEFVGTNLSDGGAPPGTGNVIRTSLVGGGSSTIWSGTDYPNAVAVDNSYVYVVQDGDLERVPIGGAPAQQLATRTDPDGFSGLAITPAAAFWMSHDRVLSAPIDGGAVSTFASGTWTPVGTTEAVVRDGATIYWADTSAGGANGGVYAKPDDGGVQTTLFSGAIEPLGIAVDASFLYVTTGSAGTVLRIDKTTGAVATLATGQGWPEGIAVDDSFVYWVNNRGGASSVMRIAK